MLYSLLFQENDMKRPDSEKYLKTSNEFEFSQAFLQGKTEWYEDVYPIEKKMIE